MGTAADRATAISAFWTFWSEAKSRIAIGIGSGGVAEKDVEAISAHVAAIDPALDWELGPGRKSEHHLCVTGRGDPMLRATTAAWLEAAPAPCETWEYYPSRQASTASNLSLTIADHTVELGELCAAIEIDTSREVMHIVVHHAAFANIDDEGIRRQVAFLGLENTVGEDAVSRWIGAVEVAVERPPNARPLAELNDRIAELASSATGQQWAVLQGERAGRPIFVTLNQALKRIDHPALEVHTEIAIHLADRSRDDGLTTNEEAEVLNAMEDDLLQALGPNGVMFGRETWNGLRVIHVLTKGANDALAAWHKRHGATYDIRVSHAPDPAWKVLERWD